MPSVRCLFKPFKDLGADLVKPYKIDDKTVNHSFELKHGKSVRLFNMDKVSNSDFLPVRASSPHGVCDYLSMSATIRKNSIECRKYGKLRMSSSRRSVPSRRKARSSSG